MGISTSRACPRTLAEGHECVDWPSDFFDACAFGPDDDVAYHVSEFMGVPGDTELRLDVRHAPRGVDEHGHGSRCSQRNEWVYDGEHNVAACLDYFGRIDCCGCIGLV